MTLGQKLRQTRLSKGLSQSQVAGDCVTRNMLSQIENDQASPSMRTLEHLAQALGVSVGWLLSDEQTDAAMERMRRARALFRERKYEECLALFAQDAPGDDETLLLCSIAAEALAGQMLLDETISRAKELAGRALEWNRKSLYASAQVQTGALDVLARIAILEKNPSSAIKPVISRGRTPCGTILRWRAFTCSRSTFRRPSAKSGRLPSCRRRAGRNI